MNRPMPAEPHDETQFNRGAWVVLLITAILIGAGIFSIVQIYRLPTDGWSYLFDNQLMVFDHNLVGAQSELRAGDGLSAVPGVADELNRNDPMHFVYRKPPPQWQVGGRLTYTLLRDGQLLTVDVPIVAWTPAALWHSLSDDTGALIGYLGVLSVLAVTLFVFLRRPGNVAARLLLLIGALSTAEILTGLLPSAASVLLDPLTSSLYSFWNQLWTTGFAPAVLAFTLIFPRPKMIIQRHPRLAWLPLVWGVVLQGGLFLGLGGDIAWISMLLLLILCIASMIHSAFTLRDTVSRTQIRWALGGFGLGIFCQLLVWIIETFNLWGDPLFKTIHSILGGLALPIIGFSLAIAVLRHRLFNIDVIIRRTVVYGLLTALLASIYFGGVVFLQQVFVAITGQRSELAIILSTLTIAALFVPLRNGIQAVIDRRLYRRKYDAQKALEQFAATAREQVDLEQLSTALKSVVQEAVQPASVSLWLKESAERVNID